jgi:hypothetical protein
MSDLEDELRAVAAKGNLTHLSLHPVRGGWMASYAPARSHGERPGSRTPESARHEANEADGAGWRRHRASGPARMTKPRRPKDGYISDRCRKVGIRDPRKIVLVRERMRKKGWSFDEALRWPVGRHGRLSHPGPCGSVLVHYIRG